MHLILSDHVLTRQNEVSSHYSAKCSTGAGGVSRQAVQITKVLNPATMYELHVVRKSQSWLTLSSRARPRSAGTAMTRGSSEYAWDQEPQVQEAEDPRSLAHPARVRRAQRPALPDARRPGFVCVGHRCDRNDAPSRAWSLSFQ